MRGTGHEQARGQANGYVLTYRPGYTNFCPGCGKSNWHVGRHTAECGFCATALPLALIADGRTWVEPPERQGWWPMRRAA